MTTKKKTGGLLDRFTGKPTAPAAAAPAEPTNGAGTGQDLTTITIRMSKAHWKTLKQFALHEEETLQSLAMRGFNLVLKEKGQKGLED